MLCRQCQYLLRKGIGLGLVSVAEINAVVGCNGYQARNAQIVEACGELVVATTEQAVVDLCRTGGQNDVATVTGIQLQLALVVHCGGNPSRTSSGINGVYQIAAGVILIEGHGADIHPIDLGQEPIGNGKAGNETRT